MGCEPRGFRQGGVTGAGQRTRQAGQRGAPSHHVLIRAADVGRHDLAVTRGRRGHAVPLHAPLLPAVRTDLEDSAVLALPLLPLRGDRGGCAVQLELWEVDRLDLHHPGRHVHNAAVGGAWLSRRRELSLRDGLALERSTSGAERAATS